MIVYLQKSPEPLMTPPAVDLCGATLTGHQSTVSTILTQVIWAPYVGFGGNNGATVLFMSFQYGYTE